MYRLHQQHLHHQWQAKAAVEDEQGESNSMIVLLRNISQCQNVPVIISSRFLLLLSPRRKLFSYFFHFLLSSLVWLVCLLSHMVARPWRKVLFNHHTHGSCWRQCICAPVPRLAAEELQIVINLVESTFVIEFITRVGKKFTPNSKNNAKGGESTASPIYFTFRSLRIAACRFAS